MKRICGITAIMLFALAAPSAAQQPRARPDARSVRAVAERVLGALTRKDAIAFAAEVHPEAVAAFRSNVIRILEQAATPEQRAQALRFFGGARSVDDLRKMPSDQVFIAYMRGVFDRMSAAGSLQITNVILGEVAEGPNLVHVVYRARATSGSESVENVTVLTLRRSPGGWKALLSGDLQGLTGPRAGGARPR